MLLGKHSGAKALKTKLQHWNVEVSSEALDGLLDDLRTLSITLKRNLLDDEVLRVVKEGVYATNRRYDIT